MMRDVIATNRLGKGRLRAFEVLDERTDWGGASYLVGHLLGTCVCVCVR